MLTQREVPGVADPGRIVAHRGASRIAPENTLAAFAAAHRQGATWIEFDVTLLGDGTPVVHHDAVLGRTVASRTRRRLEKMVLADLAGLDAGGWFAPEFSGEPLPTLEATLDLIDHLGLDANLEIKPHRDEAEPLALAVAKALAARHWTRRRIVVSSFDHGVLQVMRRTMPAQPLALLYHKPPADWRARAEEVGAQAMHMNWRHLRARLLAEARRGGLQVRVFTCNDPVALAPFWRHGLTGVITDHPPLFLARGAIPAEALEGA